MDTKALKQKILDLAIRGKLVPQDPNDEPASVLLEKIRAEKQQMVKDGMLKSKDLKNDTVIFVGEDNLHYEKFSDGTIKCLKKEIPFKIPSTWTWVRLGFIGNWGAGATPNRAHSEYYGGDIPWLKTGDLNDDYITEIPETITELALKETSVKLNPVGSILIAMYGATIGKLGILTKQATTNQACCACCPVEGVYNKYLFYFLMSHKTKFINRGIGGAQPNISKEKIVATLMPLPPIDEQLRIVSSIESLFFNIERIVNEQLNISELVVKTKSKILDLAIRGKLVPQNPDDEPATMLLARIRREKEELIKAGKLKRDKRESVIFRGEDNSYYEKFSDGTIKCIDDELPFKSPKNWMWCELQDCCSKEIKRGRAPKYADEGNVLAFAQKCNRKTGEIDISTALWLDRESTNRYSSDEYMLDGDIVINSTGTGTLGRIGIYRNNDNPHHIPIVPDSHVTVVRAAKNIEPSYLFFYLKFMQRKIEEMGEGSTNQKELKPLTIQKIRLPIPPYEEQQRIVKLVHSLTRKLSSIEEGLTLMH